MKTDSAQYLARLATANLWNGERRALEIATRIKSLTGSTSALATVQEIYWKYDKFRLARLASADCWNGGATAMVVARSIEAVTGDSEAETIVSRVYSHPLGTATFDCPECGGCHLSQDGAAECCGQSDDSPDLPGWLAEAEEINTWGELATLAR